MHFRRFAWLALLLPQFAILVRFIYDDMRELRHEMQFHVPRMMTQCIPYPCFHTLTFGWELLGIAGVIGLCGRRWWARYCYVVFAVGLFAMLLPDLLTLPRGDTSFLLVPAAVLATLVVCFVPRLRLL